MRSYTTQKGNDSKKLSPKINFSERNQLQWSRTWKIKYFGESARYHKENAIIIW